MEDVVDRFSTVEELESRLKDVKERLTEIDTEFGVRGLSEEARTEWNDLNTEHDEIEARLKEVAVRQARLVELKDDEERAEPGDGGKPTRYSPPAKSHQRVEWTWDTAEIRRQSTSPEDLHQKMRDNALHAVEQERSFPGTEGIVSKEKVQAHIERLLDVIDGPDENTGKVPSELARRILVTGNPVYRRAFGKYLMTGPSTGALTPEEQRALTGAPGSSGGFALVYNLDPTVVPISNGAINPFRAMSRVETISGTNEYKFLTGTTPTAAYGAEALEAGDNAPTLAQPDIIVEKAQAFIPFSIEVGQDWGALQSEMAMLLATSKDDLEATKFAVGVGHSSTEPKGVIVGATNTVGTTTTAAFVIGDVYKLFEALAPRFRPRAVFAANLFTIDKIRQFDTAGGSGVWMGPNSFGLQAQSDSGDFGAVGNAIRVPLLGRPVYEASAMAAALTTTSKILIVGDFRYFVIVDRIGLNIEVVPMLVGTAHRPTGQRGLYAYWRNSSDVLSAAAFQVLVT